MKEIRVVGCGAPAAPLLSAVASALSAELHAPAHVADQTIDIAFARHPERNQYHSTAIIDHLAVNGVRPHLQLIVGVTDLDLYIPILTFVFGEAQLGGSIAVVSYHRLAQEFYGLPRDLTLLRERLVKEAIHEAGHTAGLTHCDDYECVMASTHSVEWLDLKGSTFCARCKRGQTPFTATKA